MAISEPSHILFSYSGVYRSQANELQHEISNNVVCATSKCLDQPAHMHSLVTAFAFLSAFSLPFSDSNNAVVSY